MTEQIVLRLVATGKATRYSPGIMDRVVQNRLKWRQLTQEQVDRARGFVALADKAYIGREIVLELPSGEFAGPFLVADCGRAVDQQHLVDIGFAVDLSWELAQRFLTNINMPLHGVRVWLMEPVG
jgi:hypothetical protein